MYIETNSYLRVAVLYLHKLNMYCSSIGSFLSTDYNASFKSFFDAIFIDKFLLILILKHFYFVFLFDTHIWKVFLF